MILVGIGANLPGPWGPPRATCGAALAAMERAGVAVAARSGWYLSAPVPASAQPWYVNAVVRVETELDPAGLMAALHGIEARLGRRRREVDAPRVLDLDLLAHGRTVSGPAEEGLVLPHPRMHARAFVLLPLAEVAPGWRHPALGRPVEALIQTLPRDQVARPMADADGPFGTEWTPDKD